MPMLASLSWADRVLWVCLSRLWNGWQSALLIVKPETVIAWHRKGFRLYWNWKSRHLEGRPSASNEVRNLIRKMSLANPRRGTGNHGENNNSPVTPCLRDENGRGGGERRCRQQVRTWE
jgi:putative transposase